MTQDSPYADALLYLAVLIAYFAPLFWFLSRNSKQESDGIDFEGKSSVNPNGSDEYSGKNQKAASNISESTNDKMTLVYELGESPKKRATTKCEETRTYKYLYMASQWAVVAVAAIGIKIAICSLNGLNESVRAANRQADAMATANALTAEQIQRSLRALVGFTTIDKPVPLQSDRGVTYGIPTTVKNFSRTNATTVGIWIDVETNLRTAIEKSKTACTYARIMGLSDGVVLAPDQTSSRTWGFEDLGDFQAHSFVVIGCVTYGDQFKSCQTDATCYSNKFCESWAPSANTYISGLPGCDSAN